jgi:hypothetical protein
MACRTRPVKRPRRNLAGRRLVPQDGSSVGLPARPGASSVRFRARAGLRLAHRAGLAHQHQPGGLEGILGRGRVSQEPPAGGQDHRAVPPQQQLEGRLITRDNQWNTGLLPSSTQVWTRERAGPAPPLRPARPALGRNLSWPLPASGHAQRPALLLQYSAPTPRRPAGGPTWEANARRLRKASRPRLPRVGAGGADARSGVATRPGPSRRPRTRA